mgnify:CR=1 FL=1
MDRAVANDYGVTRVTDSITTGVSGTFWWGGRARRLHGLDLLHDVHARRDLAEDGVAEARRRLVPMVQLGVVGDVDEELRRRAVDDAGARHRDRSGAGSSSRSRPRS